MTFTELNAGESSRASHVWRVETPHGPEIYRRSWWTDPSVSAFMLGLNLLFGVDPRSLHTTAQTYDFWRGLGVWEVPDVLGFTQFQGAEALRLSFVKGETGRLEHMDAYAFGAKVARVHGYRSAHFGGLAGQQAQPIAGFYPRALEIIREVAPHYQPDNWAAHWDEVTGIFTATPAPALAVPLLLDWNETQFVWRDGEPLALVDVEASAFGPPELDLTFWEILLSAAQAQKFRQGYESVRPFPDLTAHRSACRLILLALESEGSPPLHKWLELPMMFG